MCGICGCSTELYEGHAHPHAHHPEHKTHPEEEHAHLHPHEQHPAHAPAMQELPLAEHRAKIIAVELDIWAKNREEAQRNRALFAKAQTTTLNWLSAPGSGKTTLLIRLLSMLQPRCPLAVVEADQYTALDAQRIGETGVQALQINTGKGCHLDAHQLADALKHLPLPHQGFLFVENVGNLVCPAAFDLGETARLLLLSLPEGEDKPLKYADAFSTADAVILSKVDLAPHLELSIEAFKTNLRKVCPNTPLFPLSAKTGEGIEALLEWLWALREAHITESQG